MGAVKNVGRGLIRAMVAKRTSGGPFQSLEDFLQRMEEGDLNKRVVENLIKCGAGCTSCQQSRIKRTFPVSAQRLKTEIS